MEERGKANVSEDVKTELNFVVFHERPICYEFSKLGRFVRIITIIVVKQKVFLFSFNFIFR